MYVTQDDHGPLNVLIVIEEPNFRNALDAFLRSESVEPVVVASLDDARNQAASIPYDLIFASESLNDLGPPETHAAVLSLPHCESARVVAVSPSRTPALKALYAAGFDAVVGPASTADEIVAQTILAARFHPAVVTHHEPEAPEASRALDSPDVPEQLEASDELDGLEAEVSEIPEATEQIDATFEPEELGAPEELDTPEDLTALETFDVPEQAEVTEEPVELQARDQSDASDMPEEYEQPEEPQVAAAQQESEGAEEHVLPQDEQNSDELPEPEAAEPPPVLSDRTRQILATLKTLGFYLSHGASAERQAQHALHAIDILYPGAPAAIWLRPDDDRGLVLVPGVDLPAEYPELAYPYYANLSDAEWDVLADGPRFIPRERGVTGPLVSLFAVQSIQGALHLGLMSSDCMVGLLAVYFTSDDRPDTHDVIALETIASMTAVAITHGSVEVAEIPDEPSPPELPWKRVFDLFPDAAFLIDADGAFVATNMAFSGLTGGDANGMESLSVYDLLDDPDVDLVSDSIESIVQWQLTEPQCLRVGIKRDGEDVMAMNLILRGLPVDAWDGPPVIQGVVREAPHDARGTAQLASLEDIARIVAVERDVDAAISGFLDSLSLRLGYPRAVVWTVASDGSTLQRRASLTDDVPATLSFEHGAVGRVFRTWQPELITDRDDDTQPSANARHRGSMACVPIEHGDRILGVLQIESDPMHPLTERDLAFLTPIAAQIAGVIERDSLYQHLEYQATTDLVTGLPNRQAFQQHLDAAVAALTHDVVSVLVLGVDGFKDINELYGHAIADDVLRQIGEELKARMSPQHMLARYTSDQFVVLLPGVDRDEAVNIAENLRITLATHLFTVAEQVEHLSVSIGAATCPDDAKTSQSLLQASDHAMYLAKRAGRNQTFQSNAAFATLAPAHGRINDLLRQSPRETLSLLIRAMDQRLPERAGHSERVTRYALAIARELGLPETELPRLRLAAYIHDIGMVSLPDALLRKPSQLSPEERGLLRGVPVAAHGLLSQLDMHESVLLSVLHQRENYDGTGYPSGLSGENIPLGARIIAVADALDAMTSVRAHRQPMTLDQALEQVSQQAGRQFDPAVVHAAYCLTDVISEPMTVSAPIGAD